MWQSPKTIGVIFPVSPEMLRQDNQRMIPLAKQMAPENEKGEAKIEVVYMRMDFEISLYDFVDLFLQNYQTLFTVVARRGGRYNNRQVEIVKEVSEAVPGIAAVDINLEAPLGKLERWDVTVNGVKNEAAFLVFPQSSACVAMGMITVLPENNQLSWMHCWRVFELIAGDLAHRSVRLTKLKNHVMPSKSQLNTLAAATMNAFAESVKTTFGLTYIHEQASWKLLGINVSMK
jgi:hypothetical protein